MKIRFGACAIHCSITALLAMTAITFAVPAHAAWDAAADEANRQRMMASMRDTSAANDRRNADAAFQSGLSRQSSSSSSGATSGSSSTASRSTYEAGPARDAGPQSVVATRRFIVRTRETEAQTIARITSEAQGGNAQSQYNLGQINYAGYGVPRNDALARRWFTAAAAQGHAPAAAQAGYLAMYGRGGPIDKVAARAALRSAADGGDNYGKALYGLMQIIDAAEAGNPDLPLPGAVALLVSAADAGEVTAQSALGTLVYYYGSNGEAKDVSQAVKYLQLAAAQDDPLALQLLGEQYMVGGTAFAKDVPKGWTLIRRAADRGNTRAGFILGLSLLQGSNGLAKNEAEGALNMRKAAEAGDAEAMMVYGQVLQEGTAVPKDLPGAVQWYRKSAMQGNAEAAAALTQPVIVAAIRTLRL